MEEHRIGIPPQLMKRDKGERIAIEHWTDGILVFNKPQGILSKADPWYSEQPDLESAFNVQIKSGKPELEHHNISEVRVCNPLEPEVTGAVLSSIDQNQKEFLKNAFGSFQFQFHGILVTRKNEAKFGKPIACELPLSRHFKKERMIVSHKSGKKAYTLFTPIESGRDADVWLVSTRYPRLHQYRIHSREMGIPPLRDPLYDPTYPADLMKSDRFKLDWYHSYCVVADAELNFPNPTISVEPPKHWKRFLRKVGLEISEITEKSDLLIKNITLPNG